MKLPQDRPFNNHFRYPPTIEEFKEQVEKYRSYHDRRRRVRVVPYVR